MVLKSKSFKSIMALVAMMLFLSSCENDLGEVKKLAAVDNSPMEIQENLVLEYSDSGYTRLILKAPLAETYSQLKKPYRLFPNNINVNFFDVEGNENSRLRANYAKQMMSTQIWEAKGNVVVVNKKGEQINTELMYWDQRKGIIYSDSYVKITTPDKIIEGNGFEANQDFTRYQIKNPIGTINLEDNEKSD